MALNRLNQSWAMQRTGLMEEMSAQRETVEEYEKFKDFMKTNDMKESWDYDYWGAWQAGAKPEDGKWPSQYQHDLSPNRYQNTNQGWLDTKQTDITGINTYAPWTEVLTQEMRRGDEFPGVGLDEMK